MNDETTTADASIRPTPQSTSEECRLQRTIFVLLIFLLALRIGYLLIGPMELAADEAYYWDWSRHLAWGYFSKPPMIAWMIAFSTTVFGQYDWAVRLPSPILGSVGLYGVFLFGQRLFNTRVGFWSALAVAATPGVAALSVLMTIDAPMLCAWPFAMLFVWRMLETERPQWRWAIAAAVPTGLGLLSKQSMLGIFPLTILFLCVSRDDRQKLRSPIVWGWGLLSLAFLMPVVCWNSQHDWVTFTHTRSHFSMKPQSLMQHGISFVEFCGSQLGMISPLTGGLMSVVVALLLPRLVNASRRERFLLCFGGIPFVAVLGLSLLQKVQPNWPAALHFSGLVLLSAWGVGEISVQKSFDRHRHLFRSGIICGTVMSIVLYVAPLVIASTPLAGTGVDLMVRLRGWKSLAREVDAQLDEFPARDRTLVIAATERDQVSELAFYMRGSPPVYRFNYVTEVECQHDLWGGPKGHRGWDGMILTKVPFEIPSRLVSAFASIERRGRIDVPLGGGRSRSFWIWRGVGFRDWPSSAYLAEQPSSDSTSSVR